MLATPSPGNKDNVISTPHRIRHEEEDTITSELVRRI